MIVISNHVLDKLPALPADTVVRVNLAWYYDSSKASEALDALKGHIVYLDFPDGRTKPPVPTITLASAIALANAHECVKYFAVSNVEHAETLTDIQKQFHTERAIELVPKIETKKGVLNLDTVVLAAGIKTAMLDKEDLYAAVKRDSAAFRYLVDLARKKAQALGITLLELQGVIFA